MPGLMLSCEFHHGRVVRCHAERPADVYAMFREAVARAGGRTAVVHGDLRWTYAELSARVEGCAVRLAASASPQATGSRSCSTTGATISPCCSPRRDWG